MEAKELMIGDWVLINGNPMQIQAIDDIDGEIMAGDELYCLIEDRVHSEDKIEPIPLTAEILEKNGWKDWFEHSTIARSVSVLVEDNTSLCIQEIKGQDSMFVQISHCGASTFEFRKHLKYVHELQHALRLCGIDKEIVL